MTGKELMLLLTQNGWEISRIRGSHHIMVKPNHRSIPIPIHGNKTLPIGLKKAILNQAGIKEK